MTNRYNIIDTTLREGEQTPGLLFSLDDKKTILNHLVNIGITEAEVGIASRLHTCTGPLINYCKSKHKNLKVSLWCRCREEDIAHAIQLRPDILSLSIPVSDIHLTDRLHKDRSWALGNMVDGIKLARQGGLSVSVGFEDATRSDEKFLHQMVLTAEKHGADRIRIADTVGIFTPAQFTQLVSSLNNVLNKCSIGVHTHNDFGMATANAISSLEAGASFVDAVVLGLGERTGCARLEEIVGYLSLAKQLKQFKPQYLKPLAHFVAKITGKSIPGSRPIIGKDIFTCETGLHVQGLQKNPVTYEPFDPAKVNSRRKLLFGAKSGRRAILQQMPRMQTSLSIELTDLAVKTVRSVARKMHRPLSDTEMKQLLTSL